MSRPDTRSLKLSAISNFRDFGGYPTADGRRLRRAWLYRSEALDLLTVADLEALQPLGVRLVYDLRSASERRHTPNRLPAGWLAESLTPDDASSSAAADVVGVFRRETFTAAAQARDYMLRTYSTFPDQFAPVLKELFIRLAQGQGPLLVNCAAGKDRTGFVCFMLHHALGVAPEAAFEDYLQSDRYFGRERVTTILKTRLGAIPPSEVVDMLRVRAEYLEAVIADIDSAYGSVDRWLEVRAGLTSGQRESLRARLTEARH